MGAGPRAGTKNDRNQNQLIRNVSRLDLAADVRDVSMLHDGNRHPLKYQDAWHPISVWILPYCGGFSSRFRCSS